MTRYTTAAFIYLITKTFLAFVSVGGGGGGGGVGAAVIRYTGLLERAALSLPILQSYSRQGALVCCKLVAQFHL